jgi:hypothetical protein
VYTSLQIILRLHQLIHLGVTLIADDKWSQHINNIVVKASSSDR